MCWFDCCFYDNNEIIKKNNYLENDYLEKINREFQIIKDNSDKKMNELKNINNKKNKINKEKLI